MIESIGVYLGILVALMVGYLVGRLHLSSDVDLDNLIVRAHHVGWKGVWSGCGHYVECAQCRHDRRLTVKYLERLEDAVERYAKSGRYQSALDAWSASDEGKRKPVVRDEHGVPLCRECDGPTIATAEMDPHDVIGMTDLLGRDMDGSLYEYRYCRPCRSRQIVEKAS